MILLSAVHTYIAKRVIGHQSCEVVLKGVGGERESDLPLPFLWRLGS